LAAELQKAYPGISVAAASTPTSTGWFEVTIGGNLVHSKKNANGFVDTSEKLNQVLTAVGNYVKSGK